MVGDCFYERWKASDRVGFSSTQYPLLNFAGDRFVAFAVLEKMAVEVEGHDDGCVPHPGLHGFGFGLSFDPKGGTKMPQGMKRVPGHGLPALLSRNPCRLLKRDPEPGPDIGIGLNRSA